MISQDDIADQIIACFAQTSTNSDQIINAIHISNIYKNLNAAEKEVLENVIKEMITNKIIYFDKVGIADCLLLTEKGKVLIAERIKNRKPQHSAGAVSENIHETPGISGIEQQGENLSGEGN